VTPPANRIVRIGVVGLGYWGPNIARNVMECPRAELSWVCDVDPEALRVASRRYSGAATTTSVAEMLDDPELDAVIIATPVSTHYALACAALDAGKHVLVEKPLAASFTQARDLVRRAEQARLVLLPGHTFLYSPPVTKIKELLEAGAIGEIYFISISRVNLGLHQPDVSVVWDLAPHDFSILNYWLGCLPIEVSAMTRSCVLPDMPDVAFINLRYESRTIVHLELSWLSPVKLRRTVIVGSQKMLVYDDVSNEPIRIFDAGAELPLPETFGEFRLAYRTGDIISPKVDATEPLGLEMADFCAAILDGVTPRSSPQIGLDVIRMIEAVDESLMRSAAPSSDAGSTPSLDATLTERLVAADTAAEPQRDEPKRRSRRAVRRPSS
jgi:predicted dehydrogenase